MEVISVSLTLVEKRGAGKDAYAVIRLYAFFFILTVSFLRLMKALRRWRFSALLYCLPIFLLCLGSLLYLRDFVVYHQNMKIRFFSFNIYLLLMAILFSSGCSSPESKRKREMSTLRMHLEANDDGTGRIGPVAVTSQKYMVNIDKEWFIDEGDIAEALVVDGVGGFAIQLNLNAHGGLMLDMMTSSNKGKRIVIMTQSPKTKWLASPLIQKRLSSGIFVFTPDCSREEADRIVNGLNNVAKKIKRQESLF